MIHASAVAAAAAGQPAGNAGAAAARTQRMKQVYFLTIVNSAKINKKKAFFKLTNYIVYLKLTICFGIML